MKTFNVDIVMTLVSATEKAFLSLFDMFDEQFYYCSLIFSEDATPFISANSYEALDRVLRKKGLSENHFSREYLSYKWSYADSPYCAFGFTQYFKDVEKLFNYRFSIVDSEEEYTLELLLWIDSMEETMRILDENGVFGGKKRSLFINAEIIPPDDSNVLRASKLNPYPVFKIWNQETHEENMADIEARSNYYYEVWHPKLCDVILKEAVVNKCTILKIKKLLRYDGSFADLLQGCSNPPYLIMKNVNYEFVEERLKMYPELKQLLYIKQH